MLRGEPPVHEHFRKFVEIVNGSRPFATKTVGAGRAGRETEKRPGGAEIVAGCSSNAPGAPRRPPTGRRGTFFRPAEFGFRSEWPEPLEIEFRKALLLRLTYRNLLQVSPFRP